MGQLTLALACEATDATDANPHLIELAAVVVRDGLITGEQFHALIKPPVPIARSGTLVHGHSAQSLAHRPDWGALAPHWLRWAQGAHVVVWNRRFHLACLDRALLRAGQRNMDTVAAGITDLKTLSGNARRVDLMAQYGLGQPTDVLTPLPEALQLARLWLALGQAASSAEGCRLNTQ